MKANEIRIGNLIVESLSFGSDKVIKVDSNIFNRRIDEFIPIPLTEEWLLKFGFKKNLNSNDIIYYILAGECLLEYNLTHNFADIDLFIDIKYVHQLQNLYFALTNEELTYEQQK